MTENAASGASRGQIAIIGMACRFPGARDLAEFLELVVTGRRAFRRLPPVRLDPADYVPGAAVSGGHPVPAWATGLAAAGAGAAGPVATGHGAGGPVVPGLGAPRAGGTLPAGETAGTARAERPDPDRAQRLDPARAGLPRAGLIEGWRFDRAAFGVTEPAFLATDPAHWLALETATRALADGGFPGGQGLVRDRTGVVIGNTLTGEVSRAGAMRARWPYVRRVLAAALASAEVPLQARAGVLARAAAGFLAPFPDVSDEALAGSLPSAIADRICGHFGFRGGGHAVDAAHSSSLLAIATACSALAAGDLDAALAGGVDVSLDPFEFSALARTGVLAQGEMRVFDARPTGFWPGEGCGFVVLMRSADARAAGLPVYAEIAGWGVSSAGNPALTRPGSASLLLALRRAHQRAGIDPGDVRYIEGDGTGTASGDLAELTSLAEIRADAPSLAALGSVKANIGHTKAAAGAAGLIKAALAVTAGVIPPATGCDRPHPLIANEDARVRLPAGAGPWPDGPRLAGVSSIGPGGTSVHVILRRDVRGGRRRRAPGAGRWQGAGGRHGRGAGHVLPAPAAPRTEVFAFSGADRRALAAELNRVADLAPWLSDGEWHDLACQSGHPIGEAGPVRVALVASGQDQLAGLARDAAALLPGLSQGALTSSPGLFAADACRGRVVLLFPGEGAAPPAPAGHSARGTVGGPGSYDPAVQPAIAEASLDALRWLDRLGVSAAAGVGHGLGEIVGLVWAGCLSEPDATRLVSQRSALLAAPPDEQAAMVCVDADERTSDALCSGSGLVITAYNGPRCHVLAGPPAAVRDLTRRLAQDGIPARVLDAAHGFYSPAMADRVPPLRAALAELSFRPPARRLLSTVTAAEVMRADDIPRLLCAQLTSPVRFAEPLARAAADADLLVETGPGRSLSLLAADCGEVPAVSLGSGRADEEALAQTAAALFAAGAAASLAPVFSGRPARRLDIWRERVFITSPCGSPAPAGIAAAAPPQATAAWAGRSHPPAAHTSGRADGDGAVPGAPPAAHGGHAPPAQPGGRATTPPHGHVTGHAGRSAPESRTPPAPAPPAAAPPAPAQALPAAALPAGTPSPAAPATAPHAAGAAEGTAGARAAGAGIHRTGPAPRGVAPWVRAFTESSRPVLPPRPGPERPWRVRAATAQPSGRLAGKVFDHDPYASCVLAVVGDPAAPDGCATLLGAVRESVATGQLVVITTVPGVAGFCASLRAEHPSLGVTLIQTPDTAAGLHAARPYATVTAGRFRELVIDETGTAREPAMVATDAAGGGTFPLGPADVVLASGMTGVNDLACAASLTSRGAALAVIAPPGPEDPRMAGFLAQVRASGTRVSRKKADPTDPGQVAAAVRSLERRLGPVTAVVYAAAPGPIERCVRLPEATVRNLLAGQRMRLGNLLGAVAMERVRLLVTFGSVAARYGQVDGACDALISGQLPRQAARLVAGSPRCRVLHVDWPWWPERAPGAAAPGTAIPVAAAPGTAAPGTAAPVAAARAGADPSMAEPQASAVPAAAAHGEAAPPDAEPIAISEGSCLLMRVLATPDFPSRVAIHGRAAFPVPPVLLPEGSTGLPGGRFLETVRLHYPGVELVADARLSLAADPYLADHCVDGLAVLPLSMALEAMAQVASAVTGRPQRHLAAVDMPAPVVLPGGSGDGGCLIQVAALRDGDTVETVLRCAETGFRVDHARAVFHPEPVADEGAARSESGASSRGGIVDGTDLYGPVCFQTGRFRRVAFLTEVSSRACRALVRGGDDQPWFGLAAGPADQPLILGSPGLNDASLHVLQACVPHRRVIAAGCAAASFSGREVRGALQVRAVRRPAGDVWDVTTVDATGQAVSVWTGVRLLALGPLARTSPWHPTLLAVSLEARAAELGIEPSMRAAIRCGRPPLPRRPLPRPPAPRPAVPPELLRPVVPPPGRSPEPLTRETQAQETQAQETQAQETQARETQARETQAPATRGRSPVPLPPPDSWEDKAVGHGPLDGLELTVRADSPVTCRWRAVGPPRPQDLPPAAGPLAALAQQFTTRLHEAAEPAHARLAAIAGCLSALGDEAPGAKGAGGRPGLEDEWDGGWLVVRIGGVRVACALVEITGVPAPVALAIASRPADSGRAHPVVPGGSPVPVAPAPGDPRLP